jgi:hypothetical protein
MIVGQARQARERGAEGPGVAQGVDVGQGGGGNV